MHRSLGRAHAVRARLVSQGAGHLEHDFTAGVNIPEYLDAGAGEEEAAEVKVGEAQSRRDICVCHLGFEGVQSDHSLDQYSQKWTSVQAI